MSIVLRPFRWESVGRAKDAPADFSYLDIEDRAEATWGPFNLWLREDRHGYWHSGFEFAGLGGAYDIDPRPAPTEALAVRKVEVEVMMLALSCFQNEKSRP